MQEYFIMMNIYYESSKLILYDVFEKQTNAHPNL